MADPKMPQSGIYCITHAATGLVYVGSAVNLAARWNLHRVNLKAGNHHSKKLQALWDRDGSGAFSFSLLETVQYRTDLLIREQHWMDTLHATWPSHGLNTCPIAMSTLGLKHPPESVAKRSAAMVGRNHSDAARRNMREGWKIRRLIHPQPRHSEATKEKIRKASLGRVISPEQRTAISNALTGKPLSQETKEKLSAALKGRLVHPNTTAAAIKARLGAKHTAETRAKISAATTGRTLSAEHKAKLTAAATGRLHSAAAKAKVSAARKRSLALYAHGDD